MNDTNIRYDAYGNKMQDKLGTNIKQTEEKPTKTKSNKMSKAEKRHMRKSK